MKPLHSLLALTFSLTLLVSAGADDHDPAQEQFDQIQRRTLGEVRDFVKQHLPEALEQLRHLEEHDDGSAIDDFWNEASTFVGEFFHTRELLGEEAAASFLKVRRIEFMADILTAQFHDTEDEATREAIKKNLREVIGSHLTESLKLERAHLDHSRRELDKAVRELEQTVADRDGIINDELKQRLYSQDETSEAEHPHSDAEAERNDGDHPGEVEPAPGSPGERPAKDSPPQPPAPPEQER